MAKRFSFGHGIIALLLFVIVGLLWTSTQLALQPSCQVEIERAVRAEQAVLAFQAEGDELGRLRHRIADLETQVAVPQSKAADVSEIGRLQKQIDGLLKESAELRAARQQINQLRTENAALKAGGATQSAELAPLAPLPGSGLAPPPAAGGEGGIITEDHLRSMAANGAIGVAVIVCKRPQYLQRAMKSFLKARQDSSMFPIVISQDGDDGPMTSMVQTQYVSTGIAYHMHHTHAANARQVASKFGGGNQALGYVYIAQHFKFALQQMMDSFQFQQVIFIEEDLEVSPDFFSYFKYSLPILRSDPGCYCVSAWNDNGYASLVSDPKALYRTEVFPGLGWMVDKSFWDEVRESWPDAYWDEFMRRGDVRKGRNCIRPEISRSFTFGEDGTSAGQFFGEHLSKIKLNSENIDWSMEDLSYLSTLPKFEEWLASILRSASKTTLDGIDRFTSSGTTIRIEYDDKLDYKRLAQKFKLMPDEKEGMRRTSYRGVIPFSWQGNRVFLHTRTWPAGL